MTPNDLLCALFLVGMAAVVLINPKAESSESE